MNISSMKRNELSSFTDEELRSINSWVIAELKERRMNRNFDAAGSFRVGDSVEFDNRGCTIVGQVVSVKRVKCLVKPDLGWQTWNVPMGMLKKSAR